MVVEATPARIKVPWLNPHRGGAFGIVGELMASSACGSAGSASSVCQDAAGEARSTTASVAFVLQIRPRRNGVCSGAGVRFGRNCTGDTLTGRPVLQKQEGGLMAADLAIFPDLVGVLRRIREMTSVGRFPGRRAPSVMVPPLVDLFIGSKSLCGNGADSFPICRASRLSLRRVLRRRRRSAAGVVGVGCRDLQGSNCNFVLSEVLSAYVSGQLSLLGVSAVFCISVLYSSV